MAAQPNLIPPRAVVVGSQVAIWQIWLYVPPALSFHNESSVWTNTCTSLHPPSPTTSSCGHSCNFSEKKSFKRNNYPNSQTLIPFLFLTFVSFVLLKNGSTQSRSNFLELANLRFASWQCEKQRSPSPQRVVLFFHLQRWTEVRKVLLIMFRVFGLSWDSWLECAVHKWAFGFTIQCLFMMVWNQN